MNILENVGEHRVELVEKWRPIKFWGMITIGLGKLRTARATLQRVSKQDEILKIFTEMLGFLIKLSMENWFFHKSLLNISWRLCFPHPFPTLLLSAAQGGKQHGFYLKHSKFGHLFVLTFPKWYCIATQLFRLFNYLNILKY